jgi:3-mercaptopyruvate sulfurtransferase SseA
MTTRAQWICALALMVFLGFMSQSESHADPSKYPQFAQQELPKDIKPTFITVDQLVKEIENGAKPLIVDVRSAAEFDEAHILGAMSAPLANFRDHMTRIPRDRLTILY